MGSIAQLGRVVQHGYVPPSLDRALDYWINTVGAGPFFHLPHVDYREARYRGQPTRPDFSLYLGHWQDLQIELIVQHDDSFSVYAEPRTGLHHLCILVDDMAAARDLCVAKGGVVEQENIIEGGGAIYIDLGDDAGTLLEIVETSPALNDLFAMVHRASIGWDGRDPVRSLHDISFR